MDNLKLTAGRFSPCLECDKKPCSSCMYQYLFNEYQERIDEHKKVSTDSKKLVIHESEAEGFGHFGILGDASSFKEYNYGDEETGNVWTVVKNLINVGFVNRDDVLFIKDTDIYNYLKEKEED